MDLQNTKNSKVKFIKKIISKTNYGIKSSLGIRPTLTKKNIKKNYKKQISKKLIIDHWKNNKTLYFYGNENNNEDKTLLMIDIDVNKKEKKGSYQGAKKFAEYLKLKINDFYYEKSTNGEGIHGYIIINKCEKTAQEINIILKKFENYLKKEKEEIKADIELVEIKGTLHEINYKDKKVESIKFGTLAKIPRNINEFIKYKNKEIKITEIAEKYNCEYNIKNKTSGSITRKLIDKEELSNLENYEKISFNFFGKLPKAKKFKVLHKDIAIFLLILKFFKNNKNEDNTIPTKRAMMLWKKLYECGDIDRGWNHHRWKAIRDLFSKHDLINWIDNKYYIGNKNLKENGIACKWELKSIIFNIKNSLKKKRASLVDTSPPSVAINDVKISDIKDLFFYKIPILCFLNKKNDYLYDLNKINDYINENFCYF
jgi:hypothetical protein